MRLVTRERAEIKLEDFGKALDLPKGVKVTKLEYKDDYFKVLIKQGIKDLIVYLRCADMAGLFGLWQNIFDDPSNLRITKTGLTYTRERELFKAGFNKARLQAAIKRELAN